MGKKKRTVTLSPKTLRKLAEAGVAAPVVIVEQSRQFRKAMKPWRRMAKMFGLKVPKF